jgi:hypothetical protein
VLIPTPYPGCVAYAAPKTAVVTPMTLASAMQTARAMFAPLSRTTWTIGSFGTSWWVSSSRNAGVSSTRRRMT